MKAGVEIEIEDVEEERAESTIAGVEEANSPGVAVRDSETEPVGRTKPHTRLPPSKIESAK